MIQLSLGRRIGAVLALCTLAGCSSGTDVPDPPDVRVVVEEIVEWVISKSPTGYVELQVRIHNTGSSAIWYDPHSCFVALEGIEDGAWQTVWAPDSCLLYGSVLVRIDPGERYVTERGTGVPVGDSGELRYGHDYRLRLTIYSENDTRTGLPEEKRTSEPFEMRLP